MSNEKVVNIKTLADNIIDGLSEQQVAELVMFLRFYLNN